MSLLNNTSFSKTEGLGQFTCAASSYLRDRSKIRENEIIIHPLTMLSPCKMRCGLGHCMGEGCLVVKGVVNR